MIYQNDWISPVLTMVDKANGTEQSYVNDSPIMIKSLRESRTVVIKAIMEPSVECMRTTLLGVLALVQESGKADSIVRWETERALDCLQKLIRCREDVIGKPGDFQGNANRRNRLKMMMKSSC